MLQLGAHMSTAGGCDQALVRAAKFEMNACQLFSKNERQWLARPLDPEVIERFHEQKAITGIATPDVHDSYLINLATPKDDLWQKSMLAFGDEIDRCEQLGVPYLVTHPGAHTGSGVDAGMARVVQAINRLLEERKDGSTMILLETTAGQGTALGGRFEELAAMLAMIGDQTRVGVCFDTCHVFVAGYDMRDEASYQQTMAEFDSVIGLDRIKVFHLNDSKGELGSHLDRRNHIGDGKLGLEAFRLLLNDGRLDGRPGVLETEKGPDGEEDRRNMATLRSLQAT